MKAKERAAITAGVAVLFTGTALATQQIKQVRARISREYDRWHSITVNRDIADVILDSKELQPLTDIGGSVEVRISPAPGGRGTEIAARLGGVIRTDPTPLKTLAKLRTALRETQWLLETGEILSPDKPPSTHQTWANLPLRFATRHARKGGRI